MEYWLTYLIKKSLYYAPIIITSISFLESFTLVGLFLPGIIMMTSLGTLIGHGYLNFYTSWIASMIGCLLGDWSSYYIGWRFKHWLLNLYLLKKYQMILTKIKKTLINHNILTILIGRFIGPTRPLIPMVCGMLKLPLKKFIFPSIIGCIIWPPIYFFPGMLLDAIVRIPLHKIDNTIKWHIFDILILIWLIIWLSLKWWKRKKYDNLTSVLFIKKTKHLTISILLISIILFFLIKFYF
ncbi:DedA family protein [Buchnera aphidicola (Formosaphis micheliae)]|uniref:DedA family protein n=1 Tax=Buchnera aphidicola TaxID=9 RepID=UPI0031B87C9C